MQKEERSGETFGQVIRHEKQNISGNVGTVGGVRAAGHQEVDRQDTKAGGGEGLWKLAGILHFRHQLHVQSLPSKGKDGCRGS